MATTQTDVNTTGAWADLVATIPALASAANIIQNIGAEDVQIVFGGATEPPESKTGLILDVKDSVSLTAANIWVRGAYGRVSVTLT